MTGTPDIAAGGTPEPPYYAVIFSSRRSAGDAGYAATSDLMLRMALVQPGCLGAESARDADGFGITVSYWRDEASLLAWRSVVAHRAAQSLGRSRWYTDYTVRIARAERAYNLADSAFDTEPSTPATASETHAPWPTT